MRGTSLYWIYWVRCPLDSYLIWENPVNLGSRQISAGFLRWLISPCRKVSPPCTHRNVERPDRAEVRADMCKCDYDTLLRLSSADCGSTCVTFHLATVEGQMIAAICVTRIPDLSFIIVSHLIPLHLQQIHP